MKKALELENFTGPLDLLLQLIEEDQLEITEVSLASVTEQFLAYLEEVEERLPEELADFLVVATKLLLLKSRALLPYLQIEDEEDPGELAAQLRMYKKYAEATVGIEELIGRKQFLYAKKTPREKFTQVVFHPPQDISTEHLRTFFVDILSRLEPVVRIPKAAIEKVMSLREKLAQVRNLIEKNITMSFDQLLADNRDRGEVVVTFLALLELVKQQTIVVEQDQSFKQMRIKKHSHI
ncbi:MAG: segregation/condensation protein A [Candidatus Kerfeldbacteria bacterium]|nr:segregation/condensation protein A [Candidatus Kerfeldbacteria bacterium]